METAKGEDPMVLEALPLSQILEVKLTVDFSYCWINLVEAWYSLEQYIGFEGRQAFIQYCGLHQVWREPGN